MAIRFDAVTDYLVRTTDLPANSPLTVCFQLYVISDQNAVNLLFVLYTAAGNFQAVILDMSGTDLRTETQVGGASNATDLSLNTWYHVAYVRDGSSHTVYLNGASWITRTDAAAFGTPGGMMFGSNTASYLNGRLADIRLWTAALTQSEVQAEMRSATAVRTANLYADWRTPSGATRVNDFSGNDRHLTAAGTLADEDDPVYGIPVQAMHYARLRG